MTQQQYGIHTLHSNNLYQIFTYVKNKEFELRNYEHTVSGMLLYAQTDEDIIPNNTYHMSGNQISVLALDLNQDFSKISRTLDDIAKIFFKIFKGRDLISLPYFYYPYCNKKSINFLIKRRTKMDTPIAAAIHTIEKNI